MGRFIGVCGVEEDLLAEPWRVLQCEEAENAYYDHNHCEDSFREIESDKFPLLDLALALQLHKPISNEPILRTFNQLSATGQFVERDHFPEMRIVTGSRLRRSGHLRC